MDQIGRYEIVSELGRGAMGVVYRARDPKIGREVAIKTIKLADQAGPSEQDALRERLFREAQSAGRLSHAGIVTIYDVDEVEGLAYIAMELVDGRTLEEDLGKGAIPNLEFAGDVLKQTAAALDYAHGKEIVHRDIKPSNLMLGSDGAVKIMDFGIARLASSNLTQSGTVLGTPSYMSPEQVRGEEVDGRADQFSLGVIAYEMLTGRKPFTGENLTSVILKIVSNDPRSTIDLCPWVSPELDRVVVRALEKKPEERFGSCGEFAEAFAEGCVGLQPVAEPEPETIFLPPTPPKELEATQLAATLADSPAPELPPPPAQEKDKPAQLPPVEREEPKPTPIEAAPAPVFAAAEEPARSSGAKRLLLAAVVAALILVGAVALFNPRALTDPAGVFAELTGGRAAPDSALIPPAPVAPPLAEETPAPPAEEPAAEPAEPDPPAPEPVAEPTPPPAPTPRPRPVAPRVQSASVYFSANERGATVTIDGDEELSCQTPCRIEDVPRGQHTALASLQGFHSVSKSFEVDAEDNLTVELAFQDSRPTALITSQPSGADIYIDGEKQSQQTNARIRLAPGTYTVRVVKDGVGEDEGALEVVQDQTPIARFILQGSQ